MPKKQPQQILSQRILQSVLTDLRDRKGFDDWWDNIEPSIQKDAKRELQARIENVLAADSDAKKANAPSVVHVSGGHGEGGLYVNSKLVSGYYTCGEAGIVESLGFTPEGRQLDEDWFRDLLKLPDDLGDCVFQQNNPLTGADL